RSGRSSSVWRPCRPCPRSNRSWLASSSTPSPPSAVACPPSGSSPTPTATRTACSRNGAGCSRGTVCPAGREARRHESAGGIPLMTVPGSRSERLTAPPVATLAAHAAHAALGRPSRAGWFFIAPALALITVFFFVPVVGSLLLSLTDFDIYAIADRGN